MTWPNENDVAPGIQNPESRWERERIATARMSTYGHFGRNQVEPGVRG